MHGWIDGWMNDWRMNACVSVCEVDGRIEKKILCVLKICEKIGSKNYRQFYYVIKVFLKFFNNIINTVEKKMYMRLGITFF